nr:PREDICTED: glutathione S-transferase L3-like isoform X2 [Daucus carota subsp. sativus]
MATPDVLSARPVELDSTSQPPPLFDGTTRLYISYVCPFAQRVWIARNLKGLQAKIELVPINLQDRPTWYKEKVYAENKDPAKREFAKELISYSDKWMSTVFNSFRGDPVKEAGGAFDYMETALHKFDDGPFFLGQLSQVDIAYAPHFERMHTFIEDVWKHNVLSGRPKLTAWFEELNKMDAYTVTKADRKEFIAIFKKRFLAPQ